MLIVQKRRWLRFLLDLVQDKLVCGLQVNNGPCIEAGLRDVSRRGAGMRLLSDYDPLTRGDRILFKTISKNGDFSILRWRSGCIKWVNPDTGDFGLEFDEPLPYSKMSRKLLDALTEELRGRLVLA